MKLTEFTNSTRELVDHKIFYYVPTWALEAPLIALCDSLESASGVQADVLRPMLSEQNEYWSRILMDCTGVFAPERAWSCIQSELQLMDKTIKNAILNDINGQFNDETKAAKEIKQLWTTLLIEETPVPLASFITDLDQEEVDENSHHSSTPTNYNLLLTINASLLAASSAASLCVVALALTSVITTLSMTSIVAIAATGLISGAVAGYLFFKANTGASPAQPFQQLVPETHL